MEKFWTKINSLEFELSDFFFILVPFFNYFYTSKINLILLN